MDKMIENKIKEIVIKCRKNGEKNIISWVDIDFSKGWTVDRADVEIEVNEEYRDREAFTIYFSSNETEVIMKTYNSCGCTGEYEYIF